MTKGAYVTSEATAIPEASATTEVQEYPAEVQKYPASASVILRSRISCIDSAPVGTLHIFGTSVK